MDAHVGARLRLRRVLSGMSQTELGDQLGITFQQIQKYEKGVNRISAGFLQRIAEVLEVPVGYFFEGQKVADALGDDPGGPTPAEMATFLATRDAVSLNLAFSRIEDQDIRRMVLQLVTLVADKSEAAAG